MTIRIGENTRVICQGFTGSQGTPHSEQAIAYGTGMARAAIPGTGACQMQRHEVRTRSNAGLTIDWRTR